MAKGNTSNVISDMFSVKIATDYLYKYCPVAREQDVNNRELSFELCLITVLLSIGLHRVDERTQCVE